MIEITQMAQARAASAKEKCRVLKEASRDLIADSAVLRQYSQRLQDYVQKKLKKAL